MATSYSPKIITDGLVLCLDAADKKSLLAPPTTNLANNSNGTINWTTGNLVGTRTQSTVSANDYHYRFVLDKGSNSSVQFRFAFDHTNLTNGETYIMSYKYKITSGSGSFYITDFCDVGVTRVTKDIGDGWYYETAYASRSSYTETYDFFDVRASDNMTVDIKEIQVEHTSASSPLATPFVSYQRQWKDRAGSNNGTFVNMNDQSDFSSESRGSLIFDGADGYINVADSSTLDGFSSVTFEAWVKPDNNSAYRRIYDKNYTNTYNFSISNTSNFYIYINGNYSISSTTVDNNQWNHIVATYDNTSAIFYKNGLVVNTNSFSHGAVGSNSADLRIGTNHDSLTSKFYGDMGSCKMYSKSLTASEVLQNYNATKGRFGL